MTRGDQEHFKQYREQTRLKHRILRNYLAAYFTILKEGNQNLVYIDGFAGSGEYVGEDGVSHPGSPLLALELFASKSEFAKRATTLFIESDDERYQLLKESVESFCLQHPGIRPPFVRHGSFADNVAFVFEQVKSLAPTFLFVDPCGISGVSFDTIRRVLAQGKAEAFIFFNVDAVRRVAGLEEMSETLVSLFGSSERVSALLAKTATMSAGERELAIIESYRQAFVDDAGARFVAAFRVEKEDSRATSHYFIHVSKHPIAFRIMKEVMWRLGETDEGHGGFEKIQASNTGTRRLLGGQWPAFKQEVLDAIGDGSLMVKTICINWPEQPTNLHCEPEYRKALLELEAEAKIAVLTRDGTPAPAIARPTRKGAQTLGKDYFVRRLGRPES